MSEYRRMKKGAKKAWLKALRSGEYLQGDHLQCSAVSRYGGRPTFCCLCVFAWVASTTSAGWGLGECWACQPDGVNSNAWRQWAAYVDGATGLPLAAAQKLALVNTGTGALRHHTFAEIADWIEENL